MKRIARLTLLLLALFSAASFAQGMSMSYAAKVIPPQLTGLVSASGWVELDDTPQYRLWMTSVQPTRPAFGVIVTIKEADKGLDGSVVSLSLASFNTVCSANGTAPNYAQQGISGSFDQHGWIDGSAGGPEIRIVPGTNLAMAITHACAGIRRRTSHGTSVQDPSVPAPIAGKCSIPSPDYPIQALRMNQHGVAEVGFTVGPNNRPTDLSIYSTSGVSVLDVAAMVAVSHGVCNMPKGARMKVAITFGLQTKP